MECCDRRLGMQVTLAILLGLLVLAQGSTLNYYIISNNAATNNTYFFFLGDFVCIFIFAGTLTISYKYLVEYHDRERKPVSRHQSFNFSPKRFISKYSSSRLGVLPLIYVSWAIYACLLLAKIIVIFTSNIPDLLDPEHIAGPQLLKVTIGASAVVFLLLVEGHNWSSAGTPRYIYATSVCMKTGIEILDSVSFLSMIMSGSGDALPKNEQTATVETAIVILSASNFLLPCLVLYKLSLRDFTHERLPLPITVLHILLHVCLIDIPFLTVRLYLWITFHHNSSIFIMKNVMGIIFSIRSIYPDIVSKCKMQKTKVHDKDDVLESEKTVPLQEVPKNEENGDHDREVIKVN